MNPIIAGILITVLLGGGVSVAAETTEPGDVLYPVKTDVNETVSGWLAVSDNAEARLQSRLIERRLLEAEELAAEGTLDTEAEARLRTKAKAHAEAFQDRITRLNQSGDVAASAEVASHLESVLQTHGQVLTELKASVDSQTRELLDSLASEVHATAGQATTLRSQAEESIRADASANATGTAQARITAEAAEQRIASAQRHVERARSYYTDVSGELRADVQARVESLIQESESALADAQAQFDAGAYTESFFAAQTAHRYANRAYMHTRATLRIVGILDVNTEQNDDQATSSESQSSGDNQPNAGSQERKADDASTSTEDNDSADTRVRGGTEAGVSGETQTGSSGAGGDANIDAGIDVETDL